MSFTARITDNLGAPLIAFGPGEAFDIAPDASLTVGPPNDTPYTLTMTLYSDADPATRRYNLATLGRVLRAATRHAIDSYSGDWYWLEFNDDGESPRRALLYGGEYQLGGGGPGQIVQTGTGVGVATVALEHGVWESVEPVIVTVGNATITQMPPLGDLPGRVALLSVGDGTSSDCSALIAGIREPHRGTTHAKATLSPGTLALFSSPNVEQTLKTTDLGTAITSSDYRHVQGRYLAVGEVGGGTSDIVTASVRIAVGTSTNSAGGPGVFHTGGWSASTLTRLGIITIPPTGGGAELTSAQIADVPFYVYGTCYDPTSFTANSRITPFTVELVPADHYVYWQSDDMSVGRIALQVRTLPNGEIQMTSGDSGDYLAMTPEYADWHYPAEGGYLYCSVYETTTLNELKPGVGTITVYPRWASYRSAP